MATYLDIIKIVKGSQGEIQYPGDEEFENLTLSEEFLYEVIVNREELVKFLSSEEIKLISPNWGEVSLTSTDTLSPEKREKYLDLLKEVIKTNSDKALNQFLVAEGIISSELKDLTRDPQKVLEIVEKIETHIPGNFQNEYKLFKDFLAKRISASEYVLIEFSD